MFTTVAVSFLQNIFFTAACFTIQTNYDFPFHVVHRLVVLTQPALKS